MAHGTQQDIETFNRRRSGRLAEARPAAVLRAVFELAGHDQALQAAARTAGPDLSTVSGDAGAVGAGRHQRLNAGPAALARFRQLEPPAQAARSGRLDRPPACAR